MTEENNRDNLFPSQSAAIDEPALPAEPQEVVCYYVQPVEEPEEVVCYYTQPSPAPQSVEGEADTPWYMPAPAGSDRSDDPLFHLGAQNGKKADVSVWREAAEKEKKRRRRGWWIALGCLSIRYRNFCKSDKQIGKWK